MVTAIGAFALNVALNRALTRVGTGTARVAQTVERRARGLCRAARRRPDPRLQGRVVPVSDRVRARQRDGICWFQRHGLCERLQRCRPQARSATARRRVAAARRRRHGRAAAAHSGRRRCVRRMDERPRARWPPASHSRRRAEVVEVAAAARAAGAAAAGEACSVAQNGRRRARAAARSCLPTGESPPSALVRTRVRVRRAGNLHRHVTALAFCALASLGGSARSDGAARDGVRRRGRRADLRGHVRELPRAGRQPDRRASTSAAAYSAARLTDDELAATIIGTAYRTRRCRRIAAHAARSRRCASSRICARCRAKAARRKPTAMRARGRALFEGKGECRDCHAVGGVGSRTGRTSRGSGCCAARPSSSARCSIPKAESPGRATASIRSRRRDGKPVNGRLLNHDTFTVQLIDLDEQLRSFSKADLREHGFDDTPMPSARKKLTRSRSPTSSAIFRRCEGLLHENVAIGVARIRPRSRARRCRRRSRSSAS